MNVLVVDNYDSFTWNLVQSLAAHGADCVVRRNDAVELDSSEVDRADRVVISPGPFGPAETGVCPALVEGLSGITPILGVCLGMQVIASVAGAVVEASGTPVHGKTRRIEHDGEGVLRNVPSPTEVGLYHSLVVRPSSIPADLQVTARSEEGVVMGLRVRGTRTEGVLFHPESFLTPEGDRVLGNFLDGGGVER